MKENIFFIKHFCSYENTLYLCVQLNDRLLKHFRFIIDSFTDCKISKALFFQTSFSVLLFQTVSPAIGEYLMK
ncbi:hypothetical protein DW078_23345 [Bacteroides fragilis]|nr:hypothetical protein DW078_23345 [Bacteroides fragilis]